MSTTYDYLMSLVKGTSPPGAPPSSSASDTYTYLSSFLKKPQTPNITRPGAYTDTYSYLSSFLKPDVAARSTQAAYTHYSDSTSGVTPDADVQPASVGIGAESTTTGNQPTVSAGVGIGAEDSEHTPGQMQKQPPGTTNNAPAPPARDPENYPLTSTQPAALYGLPFSA